MDGCAVGGGISIKDKCTEKNGKLITFCVWERGRATKNSPWERGVGERVGLIYFPDTR